MRVCDGRHDTPEGCRTLVEAEIIGVLRSEAAANARLISAAPDLYQALVLALPFVSTVYHEHGREYLPNSGDALETIQAALAKAEGKS